MMRIGLWVGVLAVSIALLMPQAAAVTTVDAALAASWIYEDGSCDTGLGLSLSHRFSYSHVDGDDVDIPLYENWTDERSSNSARFDNVFRINTTYSGTPYFEQHTHPTSGNESGYDGSLVLRVWDVRSGTSMNVTYTAYVRLYDWPHTILCYDDLTVTYYFTS